MDIDPLDAPKDYAVDRSISAAEDRAHWKEAVWLLTHITMHPRYEENREWWTRWQAWLQRQTAQSED